MAKDMKGQVEALVITPEWMPGNPVDEVQVTWEGLVGDKHYGLTMKAGSSQKPYPKGSEVRNVRQISIVSAEELNAVAESMQLPAIDPSWVGANLMLSGVPGLTQEFLQVSEGAADVRRQVAPQTLDGDDSLEFTRSNAGQRLGKPLGEGRRHVQRVGARPVYRRDFSGGVVIQFRHGVLPVIPLHHAGHRLISFFRAGFIRRGGFGVWFGC